MKKIFFATLAIIAFVLFGENLFSQGVAINTDGTTANPSAMLDVKSTNAGILVPRLTLAQRGSISNPATGLLIFQTDNTPGFYYNAGTPAVPSWVKLSIPTDNFDDADADATNELQTISISGHDITLSDGGGTVTVPDNNTTYSAGNQLGLTGTTFNVTEGSGSGLDADLLDGQHYSDIQSWVNANDDNTTYSAGTGLTLTGTVFTPTFGSIAGTVAEGNHAHSTLTRGTGLTGNNYNGSAATTWAVDFGSSAVAGGGLKSQGNFGQFQPHATYTDFNANPAYWGWNYVQGTTNAPNATSSQWYRQMVSLGSDYPARGAGGYSLEIAYPRFNHNTAGVWIRTVENGTIGGWTRIDGGANVSGTTNYVAKFTSANTVGNSQIFDNGTNVGVGTAAPSSKLHVDGGNINLAQTAGQTPFTLLGYNNASSLWLISPTTSSKIVIGVAHDWDRQIAVVYTPGTTGVAAGDLVIGQLDKNSTGWTHGLTRFYTNGGERMRIDASGNVGIGTASPLQRLHVSGQVAINDNNTRIYEGNGDALRVQTGSGYVDIGPQNASWSHFSTDRPRFYFNAGLTVDSGNVGSYDEDLSLQTAGTTRISVLNSNGYVGINNAAPTEMLNVTGNVLASGIVYWGNAGTRTETRNDAGLRGDAGAKSGFFETSAPSPAANWPAGAASWWHLLDVRHSNNSNNYSMQFAGSFFDQNLYFRKTNDNAAQAWSKIMTSNDISGTTNYVAKFTGTNTIGNSQIFDNGTNVGIGTTSPGTKLEVNGQVKITGGSPAVNKVLTSDATGLATWNYPSAVVSSSLHPSMDDITWGTTLLSSCSDDATYTVNWGFNFTIDGVNYTQGWISTNGVLGFGTGTSTAYGNTALPASISNDPMVFFHWDDNSADLIRYVVQGTSPNRTCFIQWQGSETLGCTGTASRIMVYITIHESSNVVSVRYLNQGSAADAQGANATFGAQHAGGSSAKAYPLGYNSKLLDDNATNQHFSIDF